MDGLKPILEAAARNNVLVNFDMEQFAVKDLTLSLFERCCEAIDFPPDSPCNRTCSAAWTTPKRIIDWTRRTGRQVTVRLIKGAYWDYESINAERMGWPNPVWTEKHLTDANFERMAELLVQAIPRSAGQGGVKLATGSHNIRSIAYVLALLEKHDLPVSAYETQKLAGMADQLRTALNSRGLRIREYGPVGEMIPGMAYFVRRLLENTSNQSWLAPAFPTKSRTTCCWPRRTAQHRPQPRPPLRGRGRQSSRSTPRLDSGRRRAWQRSANVQRIVPRLLANGPIASNSLERSLR